MTQKDGMNNNAILLAIMMLVACLMGITSDIYAPSLPAVAHDLQTPINDVQWTMAIFMIGVSLSQLFYGPLSEGVGRKGPLLGGMIIMTIGSFVCFYAPTIEALLAGRFVQGIGCGAGASLWRAIFRDTFHGPQLAKYGSYLAIVFIFVVPVAPTLGGYLEECFGWRACFQFLIVQSLVSVFAVLFLYKETNIHRHKERLKIKFFKYAFGQLISSRVFMGYTLCTFLCYGALFSWFTIGPVLLIESIGINPVEFGCICSIGGGGAMALAGFINGKVVIHFGAQKMLRFGWSIAMMGGALMMILHLLYGMNVFIIVAPYILFLFGITFIWPNVFAGAFTPFGEIAGYAGALYGFMQIGGGAVMGALAAFLPETNQAPLAAILFLCPALAWLIYETVVKERS